MFILPPNITENTVCVYQFRRYCHKRFKGGMIIFIKEFKY